MSFKDFVSGVPEFFDSSGVQKTLVTAYYLHELAGLVNFDAQALRDCFLEVHAEPLNFSQYLSRMASKRPPQIVRDKAGFRLAGPHRRELKLRFGEEQGVVEVGRILSELPQKLPGVDERVFLHEALACYRVKAFRSAIVMTWLLAYDHLRRWLLVEPERISRFNSGYATAFPKSSIQVKVLADFEDIKEANVIEALRVANLVSKSTVDVLREKLRRRNISAHPSDIEITRHQADDTISDLINNVVLQLTLK